MARIFITGSTDGLGFLSAKSLVEQGHQVVLHARNANKAHAIREKLTGAEAVLTGDLSNIEETKKLADQVNALGHFDAIIHNAGVMQASPKDVFHVNTLAPYILTCQIQKPKRLIYLSSLLHLQGHSKLANFKDDTSRADDVSLQGKMLDLCKEITGVPFP